MELAKVIGAAFAGVQLALLWVAWSGELGVHAWWWWPARVGVAVALIGAGALLGGWWAGRGEGR